MGALVEKFPEFYDYFLKLLGFLGLFEKTFLINFKFLLDFSAVVCKGNVKK